MSLIINDTIDKIHECSVKHGWWDKEVPMYETFALVHSELSEALEEYRAGREMVWFAEDGKPEGIATELIDAVIRLLDFFGQYNVTISGDPTFSDVIDSFEKDSQETVENADVPFLINSLHNSVSFAYSNDSGVDAETIKQIIASVMHWINTKGFDSEGLMMQKYLYNLTRPYRHGGKAC